MKEKEIICLICTEPVRVPVRLLFPCFGNPGDMTCNSMQRYCFLCAIKYIGFDKPIERRNPSVKCPLCPATLDPQRANMHQICEKDFLLMELDPKPDYHCMMDCGFRGSQRELDKHLQKECRFRSVPCDLCGQIYEASDESSHETVCRGRVFCETCDTYIPMDKIEEHRREIHHIAQCDQCQMFMFLDNQENHPESCPMRTIQCVYCGEGHHAHNYPNHLLYHLNNIGLRLNQLKVEIRRQEHSYELVSDEFKDFRI